MSTVHDALARRRRLRADGVVSVDERHGRDRPRVGRVAAPPGPVLVTPRRCCSACRRRRASSTTRSVPRTATSSTPTSTSRSPAGPRCSTSCGPTTRSPPTPSVRSGRAGRPCSTSGCGPSGDGVVWAHLADGAVDPLRRRRRWRLRRDRPAPDAHHGRVGRAGRWVDPPRGPHQALGVRRGPAASEGGLCGVATLQGRIATYRAASTAMSELRSGRGREDRVDERRVAWIDATDGRSGRSTTTTATVCWSGSSAPTGDLRFEVDGRLITVGDRRRRGPRWRSTSTTAAARVVEQTNEMGRTTRYEYSEHGTTLVSDTVDGPRNAFTHDDRGNLTALVDGHGRAMRLTYDDRGNVTRGRRPHRRGDGVLLRRPRQPHEPDRPRRARSGVGVGCPRPTGRRDPSEPAREPPTCLRRRPPPSVVDRRSRRRDRHRRRRRGRPPGRDRRRRRRRHPLRARRRRPDGRDGRRAGQPHRGRATTPPACRSSSSTPPVR